MTFDEEPRYRRADPLPAELRPQVIQHAVEFQPAKRDGHRWRQRGLMVHCDTCDLKHGFAIKAQEVLTGIDANGYPVIKSITGKR